MTCDVERHGDVAPGRGRTWREQPMCDVTSCHVLCDIEGPGLGPYDNWVMSESDVPTPLRLCRGHI